MWQLYSLRTRLTAPLLVRQRLSTPVLDAIRQAATTPPREHTVVKEQSRHCGAGVNGMARERVVHVGFHVLLSLRVLVTLHTHRHRDDERCSTSCSPAACCLSYIQSYAPLNWQCRWLTRRLRRERKGGERKIEERRMRQRGRAEWTVPSVYCRRRNKTAEGNRGRGARGHRRVQS